MKNFEEFKGYRTRIVFDQDSKTFVSRKIEESGMLEQPQCTCAPMPADLSDKMTSVDASKKR